MNERHNANNPTEVAECAVETCEIQDSNSDPYNGDLLTQPSLGVLHAK